MARGSGLESREAMAKQTRDPHPMRSGGTRVELLQVATRAARRHCQLGNWATVRRRNVLIPWMYYSPQLRIGALDAGHIEVNADGEHEEGEEEQEEVEEPQLLQLLEPQTHGEGFFTPWITG